MTSYPRRWTSSSVPLRELRLSELVFTKDTTQMTVCATNSSYILHLKMKYLLALGITVLTNVEPYFRNYTEINFTPVSKHRNTKKEEKVKIKLNLHKTSA